MSLIIIVDNELNNYYMIEKAVHDAIGGVTFYAHSSRCFFKLIKRVVPDFIFIKVGMPGPDTMYCLKKLRSIRDYNSVPVIMYSLGSDSKKEAYKNRGNVYISGPDGFSKGSDTLHSILTFDWRNNLGSAVEILAG